MERMTIHRGLAELKLIDAKIQKTINEIVPSGVYQPGKNINGHTNEAEFKSQAESKYTSAIDLIARKTKIKKAIVKKNGETELKVGTIVMTIADAITFKSLIQFKKDLIQILKQRHQQTLGNLDKNNAVIEKNLQVILEATYGKDNVKANTDDVKTLRENFLSINEFKVFDPLDVNKKIEELEKEVSEFETEVDAALSEINATTFIEF
jgi:hypothetical protein